MSLYISAEWKYSSNELLYHVAIYTYILFHVASTLLPFYSSNLDVIVVGYFATTVVKGWFIYMEYYTCD